MLFTTNHNFLLNFEHQNAHYFQRRQNAEAGQYFLFKYYEMPPFKEGMGCKYLQSQKILTFKNALFTKISEKGKFLNKNSDISSSAQNYLQILHTY